ncbi:MAG: TIGR03986 family CRISPR-associated RAMP protein [Candidatus Poribacteria bacterium]|nr:TIGR03986 family CRISPR-associated RAMP protein [Candidatus Poribacteria bacterium]
MPTPSREKAIKYGGFAGDYDPLKNDLDHASLNKDLWTGHIPIKITTVTPLVLLKGDNRKEDSTEPYDVYDRIPASSLRGMLRSAYEVVTNSRFACFGREHKERLAYRMDTREAPKLIPAIIKKGNQPGKLVAHLYTGTSIPTSTGPKRNGGDEEKAMYAAMLNQDLKYVHGGIPKTGDIVWAQITLYEHNNPFYLYWAADKVWSTQQQRNKPNMQDPYARIVKGHVFITNRNIKRKHDERIFFYDNPNMIQIQKNLTDDHIEAWENLIKNYRNSHSKSDIFGRPGAQDEPWKKIGDDPGETAWSPHLYQDSEHQTVWRSDPRGRATKHDAIRLQEGDMVYVHCEFTGSTISGIKDLFPVTISRKLYEKSPKDLLDPSLRPAKKLEALSPADRLFGWTPQEKSNDSGYKSRIRVVCEDGERPTILKNFENDPLPLTILGEPKPEQGRFYVAVDNKGTPQHGKNRQNAGYDKNSNKQLRGRKHYWHHKGLETENNKAKDYWDPFAENPKQNREYIRTGRIEDSQNRSIKGWIKPNKELKASLYLQNLQKKEIGALLWLLSLPEDHYFRLGYGKPLGFGSVKIEIDTEQLENGCLPAGSDKNWKAYYTDINACSPATLDANMQTKCIQEFQNSMTKVYDEQDFNKLPFIEGFLQVLRGPDSSDPIHYPRRKPKPDPDGKNYEWFMDNENGRERNQDGMKIALPKVTDNKGLPYNPSKPKPRRGGR